MAAGMTEVYLHVYDITREADRSNAKTVLTSFNGAGRWTGLGGVFHGGIQVYGVEWSYGYMETPGTGVYSCKPKQNPMYTYQESMLLGKTRLSPTEVKVVLRRLQNEWQGCDYTLMRKNCNNFCEALACELGVEVPGWLNRLAVGADAVSTFTSQAMTNARWLGASLSLIWGDSHATAPGAAAGAGGHAAPGAHSSGAPGDAPRQQRM